jgi:hypothetical protein
MGENPKPHTHTAFALKREGRRLRLGRWLEIGAARLESDGICHVFLDRLPIGGFTGYVYLAPVGTQPPVIEPTPQRPAQVSGGNIEDEEADD